MTYINSDVLPEVNWASRLGASSPRAISLPGTGLPVAGRGTGPSVALLSGAGALAVPRVRGKDAFVVAPQQKDAVATLLDQTNIHNYMTGVSAVSGGASGPPRDRKPV